MGKLGLLGVTVSESFGGLGLGYQAQCLIMEELSRASAAVGLSYAAHSNLCINQIYLNGNEEQKLKYLPKLISGEHVGALAMSEESAGSDVLNMKLKATRQAQSDTYLLNGTKMWITNGPDADIYVLYARTAETSTSTTRGISAFILNRSTCPASTFIPSRKLDKLGMRGSNTSELVFQNCPLKRADLLGKGEGDGVGVLMSGLDYERAVLAAGPLGIMQACIDTVLPYINHRKQFNRPISDFQVSTGFILYYLFL